MDEFLMIRASILLLAFVLAYQGFASAQSIDSKDVWPIPLNITQGSGAEISYFHKKNENGQISSANISAELEVESTLDDGFIATWKTNSIAIGDLLIDEKSPQAASFYLGVPFQFVANFDGEPVRILKKEELLSGMLENPVFEVYDQSTMQRVIEIFSSMSESGLATTFIKIPHYMSVCQATSLPLSEKVETRGETASRFGESSLIGVTSYELTSVDETLGLAQIEYQFGYDPESVKEAVMDMFKRLFPDKIPTQEEIEQTSIIHSTQAECSVDLATGWVREMHLTSIVEAGGEFKSEEFQISVSWTK